MIQPTQVPKVSSSKYGFNDYVERLNGRAAMLGFIVAVVIEALTGQGVLTWLGLR
jgi:Chlorophyll A-B binding protein